MTPTRSLMCSTTARLWAMKRYVSPSSCWRSSRRFRTWLWIETSSAETGSSRTTNSGLRARARAMPMRWRWRWPLRLDDPAVQVPPVVERGVVDRAQLAVRGDFRAVALVTEIRPHEVVRAVVVQVELDPCQDLLALGPVELLRRCLLKLVELGITVAREVVVVRVVLAGDVFAPEV